MAGGAEAHIVREAEAGPPALDHPCSREAGPPDHSSADQVPTLVDHQHLVGLWIAAAQALESCRE